MGHGQIGLGLFPWCLTGACWNCTGEDGALAFNFQAKSRQAQHQNTARSHWFQEDSELSLIRASHHPSMLADANDVKKRCYQAMHLNELDLAPFRLPRRCPVEQGAGSREIDTD
jgi:hypothetical protein